ncbi:MAG: thiamine pyrophosphate-dependent dehydrogenase E1 component subunit alpha [Candidatus Omnitrophica bacterium]|nr:thiamine pyrophosphate-dependent dehydrogenase E1 component subunit alpha [Candidatus Omnitrophota bacterium]
MFNPSSRRPQSLTEDGATALTQEEAILLYRRLILARSVEERIRREYPKDQIKTPVHLGIGEEAIPVGVCHCFPPGTPMFGSYRNHALYLALTGETDRFFGELYGKKTGTGQGKAGSMHLAAPEAGLMATSAVVGTTIPLAVGAALAHAYRKSDRGAVSFFGDGAVEEGVFWESLNFACLKRLNVLFVCEDNGLAIHTPSRQRQGFRSILEAVQGFRCSTASGDGSDLLEVIRLTRLMLRRMSEEQGPGLLHLSYFRFLEHVGPGEDFEAGYRRKPTPEEIERLDPVIRFEKELGRWGVTEEDRRQIRNAVDDQISRSVAAAQEAPFPEGDQLDSDLFS